MRGATLLVVLVLLAITVEARVHPPQKLHNGRSPAAVQGYRRDDMPSVEADRIAFKEFMYKFNKKYETAEEIEKRFSIFQQNLVKIDQMNKRGSHATFGVTKFADLTQDEFKRMYLSTKYPKQHPADVPVAPKFSEAQIAALPKSFDWRTLGAVTPVKDQGMCGSCWAFSTTGNVEGQWFLAGHKLVGLSEQNLVDCDHECSIYENTTACDAGCGGGLMPNAYKYIIKNGGIDTEASYPYEGDDDTCRYKSANRGATISNWTMVSQNEDQMMAYLVNHGPLSIAAEADEWQFYLWGVFDYPCGTDLDHGILIVGYGEEIDDFGFNIKYWIVKNSWGQDWGIENGYIWLERGVGECGLNLYVSSSSVH